MIASTTRTALLGRQMHNQIVIPLVVAVLVLGVVASAIAVTLVGRVINEWIDRSARSTAVSALARLEEEGLDMARGARLAAENAQLAAAARAGDAGALSGQLVAMNQSLEADNLMVLDEDGRVVASTGSLQLLSGEAPLAPESRAYLALVPSHAVVAALDDSFTVSALAPAKGPADETYTIVLSMIIDDAYMTRLAKGSEALLCVYDAEGRVVACSSAASLDSAPHGTAVGEELPEVRAAIADAAAGTPGSHPLEVDNTEYRATADAIAFAADPSGSRAYLVTLASTRVADTARSTTTMLIAMWVTLAVVVLLGLNWWMARGVTQPLSALIGSASRVAEGDFGVKVDAGGFSEVTQLAQNFNRMTDSLRERSESLTKKVLELATLYEMSRSLGATLELDALLESVLESALRIFDVEIGYVTMVNSETGTLEVRAWKGTDLSRADDATVRNSMSEWVVREGRPLIFNPQAEAGNDNSGDGVSGALAALCVPLPSADGTIGSITVGSRNAQQRFTSDDVRLLATIANHVTMAVGNISLFSSVQEAYLATVRALAAAVDAKDPYTRGHSDGVAAYALRIGEAMRLSPEQMIALEMAAYLHDIGKIGISEDILLKPGKLTDAEMSQMRHHPLIGANILKPVAFPWPIAPIVRHHHEHFDGDGYPAGLKSEEIPILARVLTVADSFEAMVADRPYRRGRSQQEAMLELRRCSGTHFDPRIVNAFIDVLESSDPGADDLGEADDDIGSDEAQAVYIAVCDGVFSGFRRLGGPRLASNLERSVNDRMRDEEIPLVLQAGRLLAVGDDLADEDLTEHLARAVMFMVESIERASGAGLADHFLSEALELLPERMRAHAERLGFVSLS